MTELKKCEWIKMNGFFEFVAHQPWQSLVITIGGIWYLKKTLHKDLQEARSGMEKFQKEMRGDIQEIHKEFKFINIRLSRVEGTIYGKDIYKSDKENS